MWNWRDVHVIGFSDLVDLWVIKIKKPMILCARSTSRSNEQSTKRRSRSENVRKFCLSYNQNNKIVWLSSMADTCFGEIDEMRKGLWAFVSWRCFSGADWLARRTSTEKNAVKSQCRCISVVGFDSSRRHGVSGVCGRGALVWERQIHYHDPTAWSRDFGWWC